MNRIQWVQGSSGTLAPRWGAIHVPRTKGRCENLIVLLHFDFFGTTEELKVNDEAVTKACVKTDGVEYIGRFSPRCKKYHWTRMFKVEDLNAFDEIWTNID